MSAEAFQSLPLPLVDLMAFVLGLNVGSYLNVLAIRSLAGESSLLPSSRCRSCKHKLGLPDTVPVLSYLLLKGRCRYCQEKVHWQYPAVELVTACCFVAIERTFLTARIPYEPTAAGSLWSQIATAVQVQHEHTQFLPLETRIWLTLGVTIFACTLITVTVTDFREKLIPHEITYPAMVGGIVFSAWRGDLLGAMAGIGASYMLFDFLAFYGLQLYHRVHGKDEPADAELDLEAEDALDESSKVRGKAEDEPLEVMGGGDAVLSAVMSAYLGWQLLLVALFLGFIAGTVMGMALLFQEMRKAGLIQACVKRVAVFAVAGGGLFGLIAIALITHLNPGHSVAPASLSAAPLAGLGALTGGMIGVVTVGTKVSKPFPFGPALALGGLIAMFLIPHWIPLSLN
jgi:prepilin signal peptidase PulO-like enzyme (type II secretory pathway)